MAVEPVKPGQTIVLPEHIEAGEFMAALNEAMSHHHGDLHGEIHLLNHLLERIGVINQGPAPVKKGWSRLMRRFFGG